MRPKVKDCRAGQEPRQDGSDVDVIHVLHALVAHGSSARVLHAHDVAVGDGQEEGREADACAHQPRAGARAHSASQAGLYQGYVSGGRKTRAMYLGAQRPGLCIWDRKTRAMYLGAERPGLCILGQKDQGYVSGGRKTRATYLGKERPGLCIWGHKDQGYVSWGQKDQSYVFVGRKTRATYLGEERPGLCIWGQKDQGCLNSVYKWDIYSW